jgi:hypothetical protein
MASNQLENLQEQLDKINEEINSLVLTIPSMMESMSDDDLDRNIKKLRKLRKQREEIQDEITNILRRQLEDERQEGDGFIQRNPRLNPPAVRKLLEKIGGEDVQTIKLVRTPLSFATRTLLNIASFGQLDKVMKEIGVDRFFHLSMLINGKYVYEKNAVINLTEDPNIVKSNSETLDVDVNRVITIDQLVKNTQLQMADNYGPYNAKTNNCSDFVSAVLKANALANDNTREFLSQKTQQLFDGFPSLTKKIVDFATSLGSSVDRQIEGEGYKQGDPITPDNIGDFTYGLYMVGGGEPIEMYNYAYPRCKVKF